MTRDSSSSLHDRLVECALALLESGEADVSLRAVARAADVSAMAPYRHFADKAALMAAVALRGFALLETAVAGADAQGGPAAVLVAQGGAYIAFARAHPALFRLMFADGAGMGLPREQCSDAYQLMERQVAGLTDQVREGGLACWGLVHGLATLALDGRLPPDPAAERAALELVTRALTARA